MREWHQPALVGIWTKWGQKMIGKCSEFGGKNDAGMDGSKQDLDGKMDTGLALYEPWEADRRPDIFHKEDEKWVESHPEWREKNPGKRQPTWARLRTDFYYIALRYDSRLPRKVLQNVPFKVRNPKTNEWAIAFLVDYGPGVKDRLVDCSPALLKRLDVDTEDELDVTMLDFQKETNPPLKEEPYA